MRRTTPHPRPHAFTIVETVAVISILAIIGSIVSAITYTASKSYSDAAFTAQLQAELSAAMARSIRELRYIPIDPNSAPVVPKIDSITASSINWNSNSSLSLSSGSLQLVLNGGTAETLLQNVTSFVVSTYDDSNTALGATLSGSGTNPVRRIQLQMTISRNGATQSLRSRVYLRGLMAGS
jgi:type II secretory pathway pseudopilin PulG